MEAVFHAPGRANLIGEHTDYTDGLVLPVAIDRGLTLTGRLGGDRIHLVSDDASEGVDVAADGSEIPAEGFGRFVAAVAAELAEVGRRPVGLRGSLTSDLPQGAGLSSSAALEVVVATALLAADGDVELAPLDLAALCRRAEHRAVGVPSGLMDQAASILGRADRAVLLDCGTLEHELVPVPVDHDLLIMDSGVRRRLESSGYARRTEELAEALPVLAGRRPADVAPDELPALLAGLEDVSARRLRHVVTENARVRETVDALRVGDLEALGRLFAASHASLRDDFEVSIPQLDHLVASAVDAGATAARMTGGGFGGAAIALVSAARTEHVRDRVLASYGERFPDDPVEIHTCHAADGAHRLR